MQLYNRLPLGHQLQDQNHTHQAQAHHIGGQTGVDQQQAADRAEDTLPGRHMMSRKPYPPGRWQPQPPWRDRRKSRHEGIGDVNEKIRNAGALQERAEDDEYHNEF